MKRIVFIYGLLAGLILIVFFLATRSLWIGPDGKMNMSTGEILGYTNMILAMSMVFVGVRQYRNRNLEGKISFRQALWTGFLIALVASLLYVIGWSIYFHMSDIAQQLPVQYVNYMKEKWTASGMSTEELAKRVAALEKNMAMYKNPFLMVLLTLFEILPVGFIVALISALILKRK